MIDWEKPLKTPDGKPASLIYKLLNSPFPYVIKYIDADDQQRACGVDKDGFDGKIQMIRNTSPAQSAWPANRDLLVGALFSMNCLSCGEAIKEDKSRRMNESTAAIMIYSKCSACNKTYTLLFTCQKFKIINKEDEE